MQSLPHRTRNNEHSCTWSRNTTSEVGQQLSSAGAKHCSLLASDVDVGGLVGNIDGRLEGKVEGGFVGKRDGRCVGKDDGRPEGIGDGKSVGVCDGSGSLQHSKFVPWSVGQHAPFKPSALQLGFFSHVFGKASQQDRSFPLSLGQQLP
eukprot:CAMPEP_0168743794 /NCGR_PEP_ID=MMETSP0724-20121128/13761_1 /TAXON_ID=265536 /ORGANISM="Amphiprora sp., Strain CCMP467" /LENGTH=148 /DNA_ID=CAMNT_0008791437 /DNA_START=65 /DNA_END=511 /DNA_ORIENTATION=-